MGYKAVQVDGHAVHVHVDGHKVTEQGGEADERGQVIGHKDVQVDGHAVQGMADHNQDDQDVMGNQALG